MSTAFVIIGLLMVFGGIASFGVFFYVRFYNVKNKFSLEILKQNILYLVIPGLVFMVGFIFCLLAYYSDPYVISKIDNTSNVFLNINAGYGVMIYLGAILFCISLFVFVTSMAFRMYLPKLDKKYNLIVKITQYVGVLGTIVFFLLYMEGQAPYLIYPLANQIVFSEQGITLVNSVGKSGFFSINLYALFIIGGACLVFYICDFQLYKQYGHHGLITTCFFIAFPSGIIGARAWYVFGNWFREGFDKNPIKMFYIWDGGLAIMGGAVFGIIAGITVMLVKRHFDNKYKVMDYLLLVDIIVPTILIAQGVGRIGNFFNNEVHGVAVDVANWMWLPSFIRNNMLYTTSSASNLLIDAHQIFVPLFFIEAITNIAGYFFISFGIRNLFGLKQIKKVDYHAGGSCVGWYLIWYGITRAVLEPLRHPSYNMGESGKFSNTSAYWMIGIGAFIVVIFIVLKILNEKGIFKYSWQKFKEKDQLVLKGDEK